MTSKFMRSNFIYFFAFCYFLLAYFMAINWFEKGYFSFFDIFFQTDPNINVIAFGHGWGRHALTHAFIELSAIPFRVLSFIAFQLNLIEDQSQFRELLSLTISPLMSALTVVVFYKILTAMKLDIMQRLLFTFIFALSFNNIIFSIVPETYAIACLFISLLMLFFVQELYQAKYVDNKLWLVTGFILTGVTITNASIFFLIYLGTLYANRHYSFMRAFAVAMASSVLIFLSVVFLYEFIHYIFSYPKGSAGDAAWIEHFMVKSPFQALYHFIHLGSASFSSFFPMDFNLIKSSTCLDESLRCNLISFQHKTLAWQAVVKSIAMLLFIVTALKCSFKHAKYYKLTLLSILLIGYNFLLHTLIGDEMFLYAQHWIVPLTLLFIPILHRHKTGLALFAALQTGFVAYFFWHVDAFIGMSPL